MTTLKIRAGVVSPDAAEWGRMLHRMYRLHADREGWSFEPIGQDGDTFTAVVGCDPSMLGGEVGSHRLVRMSPYDEKKRRMTVFAGVSIDGDEPSFGTQVRSYVMHPYRRVLNHQTGTETEDVDSVLDGDLGSVA